MKIIIPASGSGTRFGGNLPKQFQLLAGKPILWHTINAFNTHDAVTDIVVAAACEFAGAISSYGFSKLRKVVQGGETRADSIYNALKYFADLAVPDDVILIHDGARPCILHTTITDVAEMATKQGAAIACTKVTDTIKQVLPSGEISKTPDRTNLWQAQTPQGFTYEVISKAYAQGDKDGVLHTATDDSMLVERLGIPAYIVPSPPTNIKITTQTDMKIAEAFL